MFHMILSHVEWERKSQAFWKHIIAHYNNNWPPSYGGYLARSLETKWGCINHDMMKFCGNYHVVVSFDKSDISKWTYIIKSVTTLQI
jgi:hypothetical protein